MKKDYGKIIKEAMDRNGITQTELSRRTGLTMTSISRYIHGSRTPRLEIMERIAKELNIPFKIDKTESESQEYKIILDMIKLHNRNLSIEDRMKLINELSK